MWMFLTQPDMAYYKLWAYMTYRTKYPDIAPTEWRENRQICHCYCSKHYTV